MLFETPHINPAGRPSALQQTPAQNNKGIKNTPPLNTPAGARLPITSAGLAAGKNNAPQRPVISPAVKSVKPAIVQKVNPVVSNLSPQKKQVKGWPGFQQASQKQPVAMATHSSQAKKTLPGASAIPQQKKQIKGWPSYQQASQRQPVAMVTHSFQRKIAPGVSTSVQQKKQVKGWPSFQQVSQKQPAGIFTHSSQAKKVLPGASAIPQQKKQIKGWPSYQHALRNPKPSIAARYASPQIRPMPAKMQKPLIAQAGKKALKKPQTAVVPAPLRRGHFVPIGSKMQQKAAVNRGSLAQGMRTAGIKKVAQKQKIPPGSLAMRPGQKLIKGKRYYYPGTTRYVTYSGSDVPAQPLSGVEPATQPAQTSITGWPSKQGTVSTQQASPPCDCSHCQSQASAVETVANRVAAVAPRPEPICPTCGLSNRGCITLKGFSLNSALLNAGHKQQLRQLASTMLQQNSNAIVATGHTNSSKTEELVENLGERRAFAVVGYLKRQLAKLSPNAHKNIFWKTISKVVAQPDTESAAANRRVEICVRQLR